MAAAARRRSFLGGVDVDPAATPYVRGAARQPRAPPWTTVAATGALDALDAMPAIEGGSLARECKLEGCFASPTRFEALLALLPCFAGRSAVIVACNVFRWHRARYLACSSDPDEATRLCHNSCLVLQRRGSAPYILRPLAVPPATPCPARTFHCILDSSRAPVRTRTLPEGGRVLCLLDAWDLPCDLPETVVCPERAASRVKAATGSTHSRPSAALRTALASSTTLPTLSANPADHPVLVRARRLLNLRELCNAQLVPEFCPLGRLLCQPRTFRPSRIFQWAGGR